MALSDDPLFKDRTLLRGGVALPATGRVAATGEAILKYLTLNPTGATSEEIADALFIPHSTLQPRTTELRDVGLIEKSDARRRTRSGRTAVVWRLGRQVAQAIGGGKLAAGELAQ